MSTARQLSGRHSLSPTARFVFSLTSVMDVRWAATFQRAVFVTYEQILPDDAFGRMMLKNLEVFNTSSFLHPFLSIKFGFWG